MDNLWSFLNQTLALSVTAALILLLKKFFEDKLSPRWQFGVWSIFALRLLLPVGVFHRYLFPQGQVLLAWIKNTVEGTPYSALSAPYEPITVTTPFPLFPNYFPFRGSVTDWLFYLYAFGVVLSLLWLAGTYCVLRHTVSKGRKAGAAETAQVQAVAEAYSLPLPRRIVVLPQVESAFVCGLLRPVLVLPEREVDDKVLLHELLHLRYGDVWAGVGISLMRCLHWCNPLVWYCCGRMRNDCEALCDQRVLERLEGEARREYGVILLSMADGKYARVPGTSSMANGAGNIKRRIAAIARFKRYPAGMALVSVCVAVVLGATCLAGSGEMPPVPDGEQRGTWALTQAMLQRPTTVAGALDTYAKALLCNDPVYYAMVLPERERSKALLEAQVPYEYYAQVQSIDDSPFAPLAYNWSSPAWQAQWQAFNLLPDGAGGYSGTLFFLPLSGNNTHGVLAQKVAVRPEGAYWTVSPRSNLKIYTGESEETRWLPPSDRAPWTVYRGETGGLDVAVAFQMTLSVDTAETVENGWSPFFSATQRQRLDHVPRPYAAFTSMQYGVGTGEGISEELDGVSIRSLRLTGMGCDEEELDFSFNADTERPYSHSGGGVTVPDDVGVQCMPSSIEVSFRYEGTDYTCVLLPEGGPK